jgi:phosphoglycerate kinase
MMAAMKQYDAGLAGRTVLVRASFEDDVSPRLATLVGALARAGARVAVIAGFGDPSNDINPAYSLARFAEPLSVMAGLPVVFIAESVGGGAEAGLDQVGYGKIALLENLRFHSSRHRDARSFALKLSILGDYFIDAGAPPQSADGWQSRLVALLPAPVLPETEITEEV